MLSSYQHLAVSFVLWNNFTQGPLTFFNDIFLSALVFSWELEQRGSSVFVLATEPTPGMFSD